MYFILANLATYQCVGVLASATILWVGCSPRYCVNMYMYSSLSSQWNKCMHAYDWSHTHNAHVSSAVQAQLITHTCMPYYCM